VTSHHRNTHQHLCTTVLSGSNLRETLTEVFYQGWVQFYRVRDCFWSLQKMPVQAPHHSTRQSHSKVLQGARTNAEVLVTACFVPTSKTTSFVASDSSLNRLPQTRAISDTNIRLLHLTVVDQPAVILPSTLPILQDPASSSIYNYLQQGIRIQPYVRNIEWAGVMVQIIRKHQTTFADHPIYPKGASIAGSCCLSSCMSTASWHVSCGGEQKTRMCSSNAAFLLLLICVSFAATFLG